MKAMLQMKEIDLSAIRRAYGGGDWPDTVFFLTTVGSSMTAGAPSGNPGARQKLF